MQKVDDLSLTKVTGGISIIGVIAIAAIIIFIAGVLEGYTDPGECGNG